MSSSYSAGFWFYMYVIKHSTVTLGCQKQNCKSMDIKRTVRRSELINES